VHRNSVNLGFRKIRFMTFRSCELSYWSSYRQRRCCLQPTANPRIIILPNKFSALESLQPRETKAIERWKPHTFSLLFTHFLFFFVLAILLHICCLSAANIQDDQNVFVHLMIKMEKVTSNVYNVPCQSPDIHCVHDHPRYILCPELLVALGETSFGIRG
jgi:hypothetical protein